MTQLGPDQRSKLKAIYSDYKAKLAEKRLEMEVELKKFSSDLRNKKITELYKKLSVSEKNNE